MMKPFSLTSSWPILSAGSVCAFLSVAALGRPAAVAQDATVQTPLPQLPSDDLSVGVASSPASAKVPSLLKVPSPLAPLPGVPRWTPLGPAPIPNGQTQGRTDPISGRVTAIAVHPGNPNIVYVGAAQGGVYRSLDGGATWVALLNNALSLAVGAIAIAPSAPATVFVGTGEGNFSADCFFGVGVYRIDNADTTPTLTGPLNLDALSNDVFTGASITKILVHPTDPNTIFVSTVRGRGGISGAFPANPPPFGVYRSVNALSPNATFTRLNVPTAPPLGAGDITDMVLDPGNANNLICGVRGAAVAGDGGIWRSANALAAAPTFTQQLTLGLNVSVKLAISSVGGIVTVLAATSEAGVSCSNGGRVRRSTDGGLTFPTFLAAADGFCNGQCSYDSPIAIDPNNANNIYIGGAGAASAMNPCTAPFRRSTDGGATFPVSQTGLHADTHAIAIAPSNPSIIYTGNDGGVWRSADSGANWTSLNNSTFSAMQFQSLALHPTDRNFMIGGTQDNGTEFMRPDGTWTRADFGDGGFSLIDQNAPDTINVTMYHTYFNTTSLIGFARVTSVNNANDNGVTSGWTLFGCGFGGATANGITCPSSAILFYAPMALGPGNPNTVYFASDRLYRSADSGTTMPPVSQVFSAGVAVSAIGISPQNDNVRIVGTASGLVFATSTGANPLPQVTGPIPASFISRAVIDPNNVNTAYVTLAGFGLPAGQHIWKTVNLGSGTTWSASGNGIPDIPVNAFVVDPNNSNHLYAGTDAGGVFESVNGGASWAPVSATGLPRVAVFDMAIQNAFRVLRIATHGLGIFELDIQPPAITCSPDITVGNDPGQCSASVTYPFAATDNLPGITVSCTPPGGSAFSAAASISGTFSGVFPKGTTPVTCTATDAAGNTASCSFNVTVQDREPPVVACVPGVNPSSKKIPAAGKNPNSGQNPDGFYELLAKDNCDPNPQLFVQDSGSGFVAGPFANGDIVKITQSHKPGSQPAPAPIVAHIHLRGDALLYAVDADGNVSPAQDCLVPPPPK